MPIFEFDIPKQLMMDIIIFAHVDKTDEEAFINWILAEKMGELKFERFLRLNSKGNEPTSRPPIERPVPEYRGKGNKEK